MVAYRFTGKPQRDEIFEYPFEAIREAVINSVMHKYYFEHGHNNILRFLPDRIKIENFWLKPSNFILGETVFRRNNLIADLFARIHFGEKMGTGFERIREMCKKENAPFPRIEFNESYFYMTFKQSREYLKMVAGERKIETSYLNVRQKKILGYIKKNKMITTREYIKITGAIRRTAIRDLNDMVNKKILRVFGGKVGKQRSYIIA